MKHRKLNQLYTAIFQLSVSLELSLDFLSMVWRAVINYKAEPEVFAFAGNCRVRWIFITIVCGWQRCDSAQRRLHRTAVCLLL